MELNKFIDHTLLKPEANKEQIDILIQEAKEYNFMSVCISPTWVNYAYNQLQETDVKVCTVIGFPHGANTSAIKAFEATTAIDDGASEVDMVINIGAAKSDDWELVESDIKAVVDVAEGQAIVKVIIETALLSEEEKIKACQAAVAAGADFVKTSTGFSGGGATIEDIKLMRATVGPDMGVKASGGVSNREEAVAMIEAGATRIGASKGIQIVSANK